MKKTYLLLLLATMLGVSSSAFASTITMKTSKAVGENLSLALNADMQVKLTWGDGSTVEFRSNGQLRDFIIKSESLTITTDKDITAIYACENDLTELNVSDATALQRLYCSDNALTRLDLSKCTSMTHLDCQDNQLTGITIGSLKMEYVNIAGNQLTSSGLKSNGVGNIKALICAGNKMTTISYLSSMGNLETLLCQDNQLSSLSISKCKEIRNLVASNNKLVALNAPALTNLHNLYIDNNQLETLDFSDSRYLTVFSAESNNLNEITWAKKVDGIYEGLSHINIVDNSLFFNSFPTIYNNISRVYTMHANIMPQRPYHILDVANINEAYNFRHLFFVNGWSANVGASIQLTNANGEQLSNETDYSYKGGNLTFLKPNSGIVISATSRYYPEITLTTEPFNVIDPTGISEITQESTDSENRIFDLQGRKVPSAQYQKGIYIVNGKKIVIR